MSWCLSALLIVALIATTFPNSGVRAALRASPLGATSSLPDLHPDQPDGLLAHPAPEHGAAQLGVAPEAAEPAVATAPRHTSSAGRPSNPPSTPEAIAAPTPTPAPTPEPAPTPAPAPPTPAPRPADQPFHANVDAARAAAFEAALARARKAYGVSGAQFAVVRLDGTGWSGVTGTDKRGGPPLEFDTPLVIGSITKTFTAAAILQLAEDGRIQLGRRLIEYLPETERVAGRATIQQLLNHTSAIPDFYHARSRGTFARVGKDGMTPNKVLGHVGPRKLRPGHDYLYSNTNYMLLALLVEHVTGNSFEEEVTARFIVPLGLDRTRVLSRHHLSRRLNPGMTSAFWGSGSMTSTARDVARWGVALYGGEVLRHGTIRRIGNFHTKGYGLGAQRFRVRGNTALGHTGLLGGETSVMLWLPPRRVSIALIVNEPHVPVMSFLSHREKGQPSLLDLAWDLGG